MEFPPSVPDSLRDKPWLVESYRDDRLLVDSVLFDVQPYRPGRVEQLLEHIDAWNRQNAHQPVRLHEFNWAEEHDGAIGWRRCYGLPTDGTHRAAAARQAGVQAWVTVSEYYFERESVERHGVPDDREHLKAFLVADGNHPRPLHEVVDLPRHQPSGLLQSHEPDEDGLLGFGDQGGVARVRLYQLPERTVILFSFVPNSLGQSPCASLTGQVAAMQSVWELLLVGRVRHPLDAEWWADDTGDDEKWYIATAEVVVTLDDHGWFRFDAGPVPQEGPDINPRMPGKLIAHTKPRHSRKKPGAS
jgi:hypothetical protein